MSVRHIENLDFVFAEEMQEPSSGEWSSAQLLQRAGDGGFCRRAVCAAQGEDGVCPSGWTLPWTLEQHVRLTPGCPAQSCFGGD